MGAQGVIQGTSALVISTVELNKSSFYPFGVEVFIYRCVGVVSQIFFAWIVALRRFFPTTNIQLQSRPHSCWSSLLT